jgi:glycosyltransferase involved in cell wall biosynthesis
VFKVLIIAYYFPPLGLSGVQRTLKFAKYLPKFNWEPTVITTGDVGYYAHDNSLLIEAEQAGIHIVRTSALHPNAIVNSYKKNKMPPEILRKTLNRISQTFFIPDNKTFWAKAAYKKAKEILTKEKFDIIFVSMPPFSTSLEAVKLKKEFNIPLILDYRDLWYGNQFAFYPTFYHKVRHKTLEESVLKETDHIIAVNRKVKEKLLQQYPFLQFDDVTIIPHGFDPDDFKDVKPIPRTDKKLVITYSGSFYEKITPKYLLKALKLLQKENPELASKIKLHFVGHFRTQNLRLVKRYKLESSVVNFDYLEHKEAIRQIISSDVLWSMLPSKKMENVTPGKLYEYFGSKKPIFVNFPEGAAKQEAIKYGASFVTHPEDVNEIKNDLIDIINLFNNNKLPVPSDEFVNQFNRVYLTELLSLEFQKYLKVEE